MYKPKGLVRLSLQPYEAYVMIGWLTTVLALTVIKLLGLKRNFNYSCLRCRHHHHRHRH